MKLVRGYPEYMLDSIENVVKTRDKRMKETFKAMTLAERDEVLNQFHPDYKKEGKRQIKVGPSTEELMPHEFADVIEAHPLVQPGDVDLSQIDYDVDILIIGGGGAGTVAALWAVNEGIKPDKILIVTKLRHGDANSMMAQGGIQAADRDVDSPLIHFLDAIGGGHFTNKPDLVKALVMDGPKIIKWHEQLGMMYDRLPDGTFVERHGGGTSRMRMHSAKDYTGMEIMRVIRDEVRNLQIPILEFTAAVELITDSNKHVAGSVLFNLETSQYAVCKAKSTILATGGYGRLHIQGFPCTNHYGATADGLVLSYHVGGKLRDMDSVQYHPTGAAYPEPLVGLLCTEKLRGMGAQPVNKNGDAFVYPLEPRDVESAAFLRECYGKKLGVETPTGLQGVWLDTPMIEEINGEGAIWDNLAAMARQFKRFNIDMVADPILVCPTLHYQNGGVEIEPDTSVTGVKGLFAGGEVSGGVHGKNRLMGNSLLDFNVFGRRAGMTAAKHAKKAKVGKLTLKHVDHYEKLLKDAGVKTDRKAPMLLPEYRGKAALSRALDIEI
jgi:succinate dehydrogenase / fumarate reductase flavoprotein subunit